MSLSVSSSKCASNDLRVVEGAKIAVFVVRGSHFSRWNGASFHRRTVPCALEQVRYQRDDWPLQQLPHLVRLSLLRWLLASPCHSDPQQHPRRRLQRLLRELVVQRVQPDADCGAALEQPRCEPRLQL